jgi:nucleoside-diphosphate-sugar epimerase
MKHVCITGAAGNLGGLSAKYLINNSDCLLNLMMHKKEVLPELRQNERVKVFQCDLNRKESLSECLEEVDIVIHYAGVLFAANPEKFLATTNTKYFENLVCAAKEKGVSKIILISFPHVEGPTYIDKPSTNRLDKTPVSYHAKTRLEEERILLREYPDGIILRVGMVYGSEILMPRVAKWLAKRWLLGVWKKDTWIHLISIDDYLEALKSAVLKDGITGTYNIGDDGKQTLQEYLDYACEVWNCKKPWRMPEWVIYSAAGIFEAASVLLKIKSPLTKDFIDIGKVSYYGDTSRMKTDLLPELKYPTMRDGFEIF